MVRHTTKIMWILSHGICSMLHTGKVSYTNNSNHLFWNLKHFTLVQTLSYEEITYHFLLTDTHQNQISMKGFGNNILHWKVA